MSKLKSSFKTNIIYGAIVIIPLSIVILLIIQMYNFLDQVAKELTLKSPLDAGAAMLVVVLALLLLCYLIGMFIHTQVGAWSFERLENRILKQVPLYKTISRVLKGYATQEEKLTPALIQLGVPGCAQMGYIVEEIDDNTTAVFIPGIPVLTIGNLHVVENERIKPLDVGHLEFIECLSEWGIGASKLLKNRI